MGNQMMKAKLRVGKTTSLKEMIAYGLEGMDRLGLPDSRPKRRRIAQGYEAQGLRRKG